MDDSSGQLVLDPRGLHTGAPGEDRDRELGGVRLGDRVQNYCICLY